MRFLKNATEAAKKMPKSAWIAAVVLPGGMLAVGAYLALKGMRRPTTREVLESLMKDINDHPDSYRSIPAVKLEVESLEEIFKK
jgi:hypothetical protein